MSVAKATDPAKGAVEKSAEKAASPTLRIIAEEEHVRRRLLPAAVVLLAAAALMAWGLVSWHRAATDPATATAQARDAVLIAATSDIETLNSLDSAHVDAGLARWRAVSTGTLHDQLAQVDASQRKLLQQQKTATTGKVVGAAVLSLDTSADSGSASGSATATVIASVEVTVKDTTKPSAKPTVKRNRFKADVVRVHGTWLVQSLDQVAVTL